MIISLSALVSCGSPEQLWPSSNDKTVYKVEAAEPEAYSYELRTRECSTGEHKFATFENACQGLLDASLNNECAEEKRKELFTTSQCPGQFT